ncbi:MAG: Gfo/Idh/MocA family oxidoreductase [Dehalococcoidia bacterium]
MKTRILVIGCGSIGMRHIRNLRHIGDFDLLAFDPAPQRLANAVREYEVQPFESIESGLGHSPDAVLVCTPPNLHVEQAAMSVDAGAHVFVEKPLANSLHGLDGLTHAAATNDLVLMVGYNLRFNAGLMRAKQLIDEGRIGRVLTMRCEFGQYLPDWRPSIDYRTSYTANASAGGGIILDSSHDIDYMRWFGGEVSGVSCMAGKLSDLEMDAEDTAEITMRMSSGTLAHIHMDCTQRAFSRTCKVVGTEGTLRWDIHKGLERYDIAGREWVHEAPPVDPAEAYITEMRCFLSCLQGDSVPPVDGPTGKRVLELALTAIEANRECREMPV